MCTERKFVNEKTDVWLLFSYSGYSGDGNEVMSVQIQSANGSGTKRSYRDRIYCKRKIWPSISVGHFLQLEWKRMALINSVGLENTDRFAP